MVRFQSESADPPSRPVPNQPLATNGTNRMARIRLKYVEEFRDRHGSLRRYFRRPGFKRVPLPGLVGSAEFMAAYQEALDRSPEVKVEIGASRTVPGTVNAAIVGFYK